MAEIALPEVKLNLYNVKSPVQATVVENRIVTKEVSPNIVRHLVFDVSGTELEGQVAAGQSVGVLTPGEDANGKPHKLRLYSLASPSRGEGGHAHLISTTVKRTIEEIEGKLYTGVASNYLCDLQPGDPVMLTGPSGRRFLLPERAHEYQYLFFATGTGVAPFRGMIQELDLSKTSATLAFGCAYRTDVLYADEFDPLAKDHSSFHFLKAISRENRRADGTKAYVHTLLEDAPEAVRKQVASKNTLIYICGLKGMEWGIYKTLLQQGHSSYFEPKSEEGAAWLKDVASGATKINEEDFKQNVKPGPRLFEEVY
ncbi:MAG: FAD-binding oxidoreductase [Bacteroidetes bacterium]|nr:FAD-binding oxidoreductase [Bacteroidota bacterium]